MYLKGLKVYFSEQREESENLKLFKKWAERLAIESKKQVKKWVKTLKLSKRSGNEATFV